MDPNQLASPLSTVFFFLKINQDSAGQGLNDEQITKGAFKMYQSMSYVCAQVLLYVCC